MPAAPAAPRHRPSRSKCHGPDRPASKKRVIGGGETARGCPRPPRSSPARSHGPIAAAICSRRAPSASIRATTALDHPALRTAPAGMGRADHAGLRVGQQDRRAIGGDDAEQRGRAWSVAIASARVAASSRPVDDTTSANGPDRRRQSAPGECTCFTPARSSRPFAVATSQIESRDCIAPPRRRGSRAGRLEARALDDLGRSLAKAAADLFVGVARQLARGGDPFELAPSSAPRGPARSAASAPAAARSAPRSAG